MALVFWQTPSCHTVSCVNWHQDTMVSTRLHVGNEIYNNALEISFRNENKTEPCTELLA